MTRALLVGLALAVIVLFFVNLNGSADVRDLEKRIKAREATIAALAKRTATVDTEYVVKKKTFTVTDGRYRTLRDSLRAIQSADSTIRDSAVTPLEQLAAAADTAIAACTSLVESCEQRVSMRDTLIALRDTVIWGKDSVLALERRPCNYGLLRGPCPALSVFGGITATGHPVAGLGVSFPIKRLRF